MSYGDGMYGDVSSLYHERLASGGSHFINVVPAVTQPNSVHTINSDISRKVICNFQEKKNCFLHLAPTILRFIICSPSIPLYLRKSLPYHSLSPFLPISSLNYCVNFGVFQNIQQFTPSKIEDFDQINR